MNLLQGLLNSKTHFCTHEPGCIVSALKITFKNLKYGLVISAVLQLLKSLKSATKGSSAFKGSFTPRYFTIAVFMCATVLTLRLVRCILRRIRDKDDAGNSIIAGGVAGWVASKTLSKEYWYFYLTFLGSRLIGALHKILIAKNILKEEHSALHSYAMMTFAHIIHSYGYFLHPYILNDDMYGLYRKMSALTPREQRWHLVTLRYNHRRLLEKFGSNPDYDQITLTRMQSLKDSIIRAEQQGCN